LLKEISSLLSSEEGRHAHLSLSHASSLLTEHERAAWRICLSSCIVLDENLRETEREISLSSLDYEEKMALYLREKSYHDGLVTRYLESRGRLAKERERKEREYAERERKAMELAEALVRARKVAVVAPSVYDPKLREVTAIS
jgi:hypothetical protein